ncbi:hypothetical protein Tco_0609154 [Tanacetum coccineum]
MNELPLFPTFGLTISHRVSLVTLLHEINEIALSLALVILWSWLQVSLNLYSFRLDRSLPTLHLVLDNMIILWLHHESLLTISLDRLDIFEGRSCISEFVRNWSYGCCGRFISILDRVFPAQSVGSSNTDVLDFTHAACSHYRNVSKQTTRHLPQCCLMMTLEGFPFVIVNTKEYHSECSGRITRIMRRTLVNNL